MTDPAPASRGSVVGLFVKPAVDGEHGLPKRPVRSLRVEPRGAEGDFNRYRQEVRQGDPEMALLVMAEEALEEIRRDGWPVQPGDIGENLLVRGVPYAELAPPGRFAVGPAAIEVAKACDPCTNLWSLPYVGESRGPDFLRAMHGRRGWYARVTRAAQIQLGDPVRRLP